VMPMVNDSNILCVHRYPSVRPTLEESLVPKLLVDIKHGRQFMKHRSSCNVLRPMDRVFMGKISTFSPVNWNKLKNSYHYDIMQTRRGQHIFYDAKSANFMKGSRDTCGQSKMYVFNDFLKFYYTLLYTDVL
jgi:hypothetical protein